MWDWIGGILLALLAGFLAGAFWVEYQERRANK